MLTKLLIKIIFATFPTKSTACFPHAAKGCKGLGHCAGGTPMVQSIFFGIVLYLTPSVLLLGLLACRESFDDPRTRSDDVRQPNPERGAAWENRRA